MSDFRLGDLIQDIDENKEAMNVQLTGRNVVLSVSESFEVSGNNDGYIVPWTKISKELNSLYLSVRRESSGHNYSVEISFRDSRTGDVLAFNEQIYRGNSQFVGYIPVMGDEIRVQITNRSGSTQQYNAVLKSSFESADELKRPRPTSQVLFKEKLSFNANEENSFIFEPKGAQGYIITIAERQNNNADYFKLTRLQQEFDTGSSDYNIDFRTDEALEDFHAVFKGQGRSTCTGVVPVLSDGRVRLYIENTSDEATDEAEIVVYGRY